MTDWKPESTAPINKAILVWEGSKIAVGRKLEYSTQNYPFWMIDDSFGFNEDGQIYDVTHWAELPEPPK
jgi:hypothetical protein